MDRRSILVIVACASLLLLWMTVIVPKMTPPPSTRAGTTNTTHITVTNLNDVQQQIEAAALSVGAAPKLWIDTNANEQLLVLTNDDARYTFSSYGGGLKLVELIHYPETVPSWREKKSHAQTNRFATLNTGARTPTLAVLGGSVVQGDGIFTLTNPTPTIVRAEKTLSNGLTLVKEFSLGTNYLLHAAVRLENHSTQSLALPAQEWVVGTATPMNDQDRGQFVGLMYYNGDKSPDVLGTNHFSNRSFGCVPRTPPTEYRAGDTNVAWVSAHNQYFALVMMPKERPQDLVMRRIDLRLTDDMPTNAPPLTGYETAMVYPAMTLAGGQSVQREFTVFAGPKEYRTLARLAALFNNNLDALMSFGWAGFFAKGLLLAMNWLHAALKLPYGWTIVGITVIIKLIFWPLTAASTRSMKKMQALAPEANAIKEKYKDDPAKAFQKQQELYKKNGVNQLGSCLPVFVQMPVFIGFFTMINRAIELRGAAFLWIPDLSQPDTLFIIPGLDWIPFIGVQSLGLPVNLLPIIMVGTMLWQSHLAPTSPGMDPAQQKMMRYMPLIFLVILYNYSAGMALSGTTNNLLTILQTKLTKSRDPATPAPALTSPPKKKK